MEEKDKLHVLKYFTLTIHAHGKDAIDSNNILFKYRHSELLLKLAAMIS